VQDSSEVSLNTSLSMQGVANFLGNITGILQEFEGTPSPPQTAPVDQSTPDMTNDSSTITLYDGGIPAEFQGGRRKLLQSTVRLSPLLAETMPWTVSQAGTDGEALRHAT
jgi:hypothetical protein